jgi:hypothetical protein
MAFLLAMIPVVLILAYFLGMRRDTTWDRFRRLQRERARRTGSESPINPTFQFDEPASPADLHEK